MSCEWAWEEKHERRRRKKGPENEKGGTTKKSNGRERGRKEKKRRKKAEKQVVPSRELACWRSASAENNGPYFRGTHSHTHCRMLVHTVHVRMKLNSFQGLLSVFVNKVLSDIINLSRYHELQTDQSRKLTWLHSPEDVNVCVHIWKVECIRVWMSVTVSVWGSIINSTCFK